MKKIVFTLMFCVLQSSLASAQWAVYDDEVKRQLKQINDISALQGMGPSKTYDHFESERQQSGDVKIGAGSSEVVLKSLDTRFDQLPDLTDTEKSKYVGTVQDCGQKEVGIKHWEACVGLRNLRLQTLKQSHGMLNNLAMRRSQIVNIIKKSREVPQDDAKAAGVLQRYQFELQGQQALMQADAMQLQVLMDGYRQREAGYMLQQAEARKSMLSRAEPTTSAKAPKFFPLIRATPSN